MRISGKTKLIVIIGDPVEHTLSPKMHNAAYEALGIDDQFVYTACRVKVEDVKEVVAATRVMGIRGLTCTVPHKIEVMKYLDKIDPVAQKIGAVNTVVNENGKLLGYNTDWLGVTLPLEKMTKLSGKKVALIGAGGAARAIAFGVVKRGAKLRIYNRTVSKAQELAQKFNASFAGLDKLEEVKDADIVINSTIIGMVSNEDKTPVPKEFLTKNQIAFDCIYVPSETRFLKEARKKGAKIIHGIEMLLYQGTAQFELYTNHKAPEDIMRKALYEHFNIK